jgi:hypothetical protein
VDDCLAEVANAGAFAKYALHVENVLFSGLDLGQGCSRLFNVIHETSVKAQMYIYLSLLIATIGALLYALSIRPKAVELGRLMFACGLFVFLLRVVGPFR